jgi:citrate synthase
MLDEIGDVSQIGKYVEKAKDKDDPFRLMGFGHRVYKNYDPRARIIRQIADEVFEVTGRNPKIELAKELERIALEDDYFVKRKLYPNVDFYSGIIYQAMGFQPEMFTVLFAIPRTSGWLAHWEELMNDAERRIARPRQIYLGPDELEYVPIEERLGKAQSART